jgi:uncharacterized SAM-binding protein YcdF (DUF218 family)
VIKCTVRWILRLVSASLLGVVLVVWLAPHWVLPPVARFLDVSETPRATDYVLVLNGDPEIRPFAAAALVKAGLAREVLLTRQRLAMESSSVQEGVMPSELAITQKILNSRGVPEASIQVLPGEITSTGDEARVLAEFLAAKPEATVAIVTNAFHTRRARMVFHRTLGENSDRVHFVGVPRDGVDEDSWWRTSGGCAVYVSEYGKFPYYWFRY